MASIIIGAATQVSFRGDCVISANWGYNPNPQRLYCIGSWDPYQTYYRPTETLNLTIYAPGTYFGVTPTTGCANATTVQASISPAACGEEDYPTLGGQWMVTGYSFSKDDASLPGQESWSLTRWTLLASTMPTNAVEPSFVMRGIAEGQGTGNAGIDFGTTDTVNSYSGNVSAGGFGRADTLTAGVVVGVGGGSSLAGDTGQGSVSIPYTPLYI
jgi:hypothetical protein